MSFVLSGRPGIARVVLSLLAIFATGLVSSERVTAHGAVAEAYWRDGSTSRYIYGIISRAETSERARSEALASCRQSAASTAGAEKCEIAATFNGYCIATSSTGDKNGVGAWAVALSESAAKDQALDLCKNSASWRSGDCRVTNTFCDVSGVGSLFIDGKQSNVFPQPPGPIVKIIGGLAGFGFLCFLVWKLVEYFSNRRPAMAVPQQARPHDERSVAIDPDSYQPPYPMPPQSQPRAQTTVLDQQPMQLEPLPEISLRPVVGGPAVPLDAQRLAASGLIAGRGTGCDVMIQEPTLSGRHARFWLDPEKVLRVEDLNSTNGTGRNGQSVLRASLKDGDLLRLGQAEFKVVRR